MTNRLKNLCFRCGRSCSGLSAHTDPAGRLVCPHCVQAAGTVVELDGTIAVIDQAPSGTRAPCPYCGAPLAPGVAKCGSCGKLPSVYTAITEQNPSMTPTVICSGCGYDLKGLPTLKCPECGVVNSRRSRAEELEETSREVLRAEIRKPAILAAVSVTMLVALLAFSRGMPAAGAFLLWFPAAVAVASGTFWVCGMLGLGLDPPLWLVALRMTAIVATVQLVNTVCAATRLPGAGAFGFILGLVVFAFLLTELFDLELSDSWIIILLNTVAWVVIAVIIATLL